MGIIDIFKDAGLKSLLFGINKLLDEYGKVEDMKVDREKKRIDMEVLLKGEEKSIKIKVNGYRIESKGEKSRIILKDVRSDRKWLDAVFFESLKLKAQSPGAFLI